MINLCNRTEYSFKLAYGQLGKVIKCQGEVAGICDRHGTWGHVNFEAACIKAGIKPVFGVELAYVEKPEVKEKQGAQFMRFLALTNAGLKQIYELTTQSTHEDNFYYFPRIGPEELKALGKDVVVISSIPISEPLTARLYIDLSPVTSQRSIDWAEANNTPLIATSDNFYPEPDHKDAYEVCIAGNATDKATPIHILDEHEWNNEAVGTLEQKAEALNNAILLGQEADVKLPWAELVHPPQPIPLRQMCINAAPSRGVDLSDPEYAERLDMELGLIDEKNYADYFYLIADIIAEAKKTMLVGPARGSSCGSLVCYLIGITEVDPIPYSLLFERFIDINREDLPDIDIDFPDVKRQQVFDYIRKTYGSDHVAQLGTVSKFKAKSTISEVAKGLLVPAWEVNDLKDAIIERSSGDSRSAFCILDTFNELDIGKDVLKKYPEMAIASEIEQHARHSGKHAAGIVVTKEPVSGFCSIDLHAGAAQVDKKDAEKLNLLKIDALGLRTLSVLEDCLEQAGWSNDDLLKYPLDDKGAFKLLNDGKFSGIFQYEGYALQSLCHQMEIDSFEDVVSITALARPGPLNSGMATEWLKRRMGEKAVTYEHPSLEPILKTSFGVVIYQENIMQIAREIGGMSWADVSSLRKAMSKSLGQEFFDQYKKKFLDGAAKKGFEGDQAVEFWDKINTFGSWAFNRSHAVAYGMVSYWCLVLKSKFPLEYAAACLRHSKSDDQSIKMLRELFHEGYEHTAFDKELSKANWSVQDGKLVGGLIGVKGIGQKTADSIVKRRAEGKKLTAAQIKKIEIDVQTPFDMIFECRDRWGHILDAPHEHGINSPLTELKEITQNSNGTFVIIAKLTEKNLRDHNELVNLNKRGGRVIQGQSLFLNLTIEDDTDSMICTIDRFKYMKYGKPIIEGGKAGDWYIIKGKNRKGFRKLYIDRWKKLS